MRAPDVLADESTLALPGTEPVAEDDVEPAPLALHAKIFCFHSGEKTIMRVGSANATERAWSGRNSEIMVELEAGEAFASGLAFLVGKATPVTIEELAATDLRSTSAADALEESRKVLMASWDPVLRRDGDCFSIDARAVPSLAYPTMCCMPDLQMATCCLGRPMPSASVLDRSRCHSSLPSFRSG